MLLLSKTKTLLFRFVVGQRPACGRQARRRGLEMQAYELFGETPTAKKIIKRQLNKFM
jgi:hypothetical protein